MLNLRPDSRILSLATWLLLTHATCSWAETADPTTPSASIAERLRPEKEIAPKLQPLVDAGSKPAPPIHLRLKGIVLRDKDNGTAILSLGSKEYYSITLRRAGADSETVVLQLDDKRLALKDFSESCVILQCIDTDEQYIAR